MIQDGYSSELINRVLESKEFSENNNIEIEAQKTWNKLSEKYTGDELIFRFKNKLYSKGFTQDEINNVLDKLK